MGDCYGQLSLEERCKIAELHQAGHSLRQIAAALDRSPSSVSRELKRNRGAQVGYKAVYAQEQAAARRWKGSRLERNAELRDLVLDRLSRGWSPEQIAGRLDRAKAAARISHERSIASSMIRSAEPTTVRGACTCPEPSTNEAAAAPVVPRTA